MLARDDFPVAEMHGCLGALPGVQLAQNRRGRQSSLPFVVREGDEGIELTLRKRHANEARNRLFRRADISAKILFGVLLGLILAPVNAAGVPIADRPDAIRVLVGAEAQAFESFDELEAGRGSFHADTIGAVPALCYRATRKRSRIVSIASECIFAARCGQTFISRAMSASEGSSGP